jgi:hypothetical protein
VLAESSKSNAAVTLALNVKMPNLNGETLFLRLIYLPVENRRLIFLGLGVNQLEPVSNNYRHDFRLTIEFLRVGGAIAVLYDGVSICGL